MKLPRILTCVAAGVLLAVSSFGAQEASPVAPSAPAPVVQTPAASSAAQTPAAGAGQGSAQSKEPAPIRVTTPLVNLTIVVTDKRHNFITDLNQSDFKILENGTPQDIRYFARETDLPLRIGVLLDTSNSIRPRLQFEQDAAIDFLSRTLRPIKDEAFLMTFDNEPQIIQDYTDDVGRLTDAIRDQRAGGGTALNDAIYLASQKLEKAPLPDGADKSFRRVIVVISDGNDNLSDRAPSDAIESVIRSGAAVYAISTNTDWISEDQPDSPHKYEYTDGDKILMKFSDQTGGRTFFPYKVEDLGQSFVEIGTELRSEYFAAYQPSTPPDGKYRNIDVQVQRGDRKSLVVRTRKGYYAEATSGGGPVSQ